jgi:rhodanese-related sulfurtransferase
VSIPAISVQQLQQLLRDSDPTALQLVDVRESPELEICRLSGFQHYPLSQHESWSLRIPTELDPDRPVYVICHHGMRSAQMVSWLHHQGYTQATNITGGIHAWSVEIDPSVPQY